MTTAVVDQDQAEPRPAVEEPPPPPRRGRRFGRGWLVLGVLAVWTACAIFFQGKATLVIGGADQVGVQNWLADRANDIVLSSGNVIISFTHWIADVLGAVIEWLQFMISTPAFPSPYPHIGFLGVLAIAWFVTALVAGWRM